jgi:Circularly permutated YpsA SLOG family
LSFLGKIVLVKDFPGLSLKCLLFSLCLTAAHKNKNCNNQSSEMRLKAGERIGRFGCGEKEFRILFLADKSARDRAALDWALQRNVECGGWCPKGWKAEEGPIDPKYPLKETPSASYLQRTEWNVRDSDATVLLSVKPVLTGGSKRTVEFVRKHRRPHLHLYAGDNAAADKLKAFSEEHRVKILNVAGPRASKEPGVEEFVISTLDKAFTDIGG